MERRRDDHQSGNLNCSFCGKSQKEVKKLIAGPTVYICDECIGLCNDIIAEEIEKESESFGLAPVPKPAEIKTDTDRDNFMSAGAAKEYGIIDEVLITAKKKPDGGPERSDKK